MPKPDIEVLDDGDAYPYSSHISVESTELQLGDLLLVFESPTIMVSASLSASLGSLGRESSLMWSMGRFLLSSTISRTLPQISIAGS